MASLLARALARRGHQAVSLQSQVLPAFASRSFAAASAGDVLDLGASTSLQQARSWDDGVSSSFATSSLADVFKGKKVVIFGVPGAFTGVCTKGHVPSYVNNVAALKAKGVDSVICTAVNDPYTLNAWAEQMGAKSSIEFMADFNGSFAKLLGVDLDLSIGLLGHRSQRWAAVVEDGVVKVMEVEKSPGDLELTKAESILKHL